ncbi:MAG TPA: hypothetical protein VEJ36_08355 [Nitrososphaerales archaeon]|nr:hypothetical protein [Nitrososphaerales archaeon]
MQPRAKKALAASIGFMMVFMIFGVLSTSAITQQPGLANSVSLQIVPARLPADGGTYQAAVVSLLDKNGMPTIALTPVTVYLFSSEQNVATVSSQVTIAPGQSYTVASITTTVVPGQTELTASSSGLQASSALVATSTPSGFPSQLKVFVAPSTEIARPNSTGVVVVELLDQTGLPTESTSDLTVQLAASNPTIANVSSKTMVIESGQLAAFGTYSSSFLPGSSTFTASASGLLSGSGTVNVEGPSPLVLHAYPEPSNVPTSSSGSVVFSLSDASGNPARAPSNIDVEVTSSNESVATTDSQVVIPAGQIYTTSSFASTAEIGKAVLTATSPGLESVSVPIQSSNAGDPVQLHVSIGPNPVLADSNSYNAVSVSIENATGAPSVFDAPITVELSSSDSQVGVVPPTVTIEPGSDYATTTFNSTYFGGNTTITASASNLLPSQGSISTYGSTPFKLALAGVMSSTGAAGSTQAGPVLPANGGSYESLEVLLENSQGQPALAATNVDVQLLSAETSVVGVSSIVTIDAGSSFAITSLQTSTLPGNANITSVAPGLESAVLTVSTETPAPSSLAAYISPSKSIQSSGATSPFLVVQLQDSSGNPARARAATPITITSSNGAMMTSPIFLTIPQGADYAIQPLSVLTNGTSTLTVTSPGLGSASAPLATVALPVSTSIAANPTSLLLDQSSTVTVTISVLGEPLSGTQVAWNATDGTVSASSTNTTAGGRSQVIFTPKSTGVAIIEAIFTNQSIGSVPVKISVPVTAIPPAPTPTLAQRVYSYLIFIIAAVVIVIVGISIWFRRRRRRMREELEAAFQTLS